MIKRIFSLKRLPQLSRHEFQRYWREQHAPLVKRHAAALSAHRYVQSHTMSDPRLAMVSGARGSTGLDFDGVAELWWDSLESRLAAVSTDARQIAGRELLEDEARFIDLPSSPIFLTEELEVVG